MTYSESATLMTDLDFRGRVKVACLKFADSIMIEQPNVPAHNSRERWAQETFAQPDLMAQKIQPPTVMDVAVQSSGAAVTDGALQIAVETVVGKII